MMRPAKPPFRADHVGSLIRPDALIAAREAADKGDMAADELTRIQEAAIRDVVRLQRDAGLKVVTDGEYNRFSWQRDFLLKIGNVKPMASRLTVRFHSAAGTRGHAPPDRRKTRPSRDRHWRRSLRGRRGNARWWAMEW